MLKTTPPHARARRILSAALFASLLSLPLLPDGLAARFRPSAGAAAAFVVNSTGDGADANTADDSCGDASGNCTLRAAIEQANATPGADDISFSVTGTINLTGPLPSIAGSMTVNGPGPGLLSVRRDTGGDYRIFTVTGGTVTLSGMTITNGKSPDGANATAEQPGAGGRGGFGGGVFNEAGAVLTLANCVISNNTTGRGGDAFSSTFVTGGDGGLGGGIFNLGSLVVSDCVISGNRTGRGGKGDKTENRATGGGGFGGTGGGLWSGGFGTLTITNSSFVNNTCGDGGPGDGTLNTAGPGGSGGGLYYNVVTGVPAANVSGTTFSGNQTGNGGPNGGGGFGGGHGGGIYLEAGSMTLTNSVVTGNRTGAGAAPAGPSGGGGWGAGIFNSGILDIVASTISNNQTAGGTGSAPAGSGAGIRNVGNTSTTVRLTNSTVSGNTTGTGGNGTPGTAGGIHNSSTLVITGSTLSGNTGGGGSAVYNLRNLTLTNSTVSGNHIPSVNFHDGAIVDDSDNVRTRIINCTIVDNDGPGVQADLADNFSESSPRVGNTIIAGNGNGTRVDANGLYVSLGHNLVSKVGGGGGNGFSNGNMGDQVGSIENPVDARLRPLADNGGPTLTHAPLPGSPVLDAGDNAVALDPAGNPLTTDQRGPGFPRVADWADADTTQTVDIGAFETHPFVEDVADKTTDEDTALSFSFNAGDAAHGITITAASSNQALLPDAGISVGGAGQSRTLTATPAANASGTTTITLTVTAANGRSVSDSFQYQVLAVNDAPVNTVPGPQTTARNTPLVFSAANSNAISVSDVDTSSAEVRLTATNGTLMLGRRTGLAFIEGDGIDDATMLFAGLHSNINAALSGLTFTPAQGFTGAASVQITVSDQGNTGSGGAKTDTDTVTINVVTGGSLQFSAPAFEANEDGATATLKVTRTGGSAGAASVNFGTSGGTAMTGASCGVSGTDYVPANGSLTWADGDDAERTITITLCDDTVHDPDETFNVTLSGATGSVAIGTPASATVTIRDDDPTGGRIEFTQAVYAADENSFAAVRVRRDGDARLAVGVDYSTDDGSTPSVAVPCASTTGQALHRCDFTQAVGRLSFAAGETEKFFLVLVGDDSYVEGGETALIRLSNPGGGAVLGQSATAMLFINDDSPETSGNPNDISVKFVRQHYHDFFSREPDASGLAHWTSVADNCGDPDPLVCRINVSGAFFLSIEFTETGFLVERAYKAAFGDAVGTSTLGGTAHTLTVPVIRFEEFLPDTQQIGRGVVVLAPGWEALLEANKTAYFLEFVQRSRFTAAFPAGMTPAAFVEQLNMRAGNPLDDAERTALINELTANNTTAGRASVLRKVAEDGTLADAEKNRAFVLMQYFGYLRRNPNDPPDADYTGYDFWLGNLEKFGGNFVQAELVKAFILSAEYRRRFGQ